MIHILAAHLRNKEVDAMQTSAKAIAVVRVAGIVVTALGIAIADDFGVVNAGICDRCVDCGQAKCCVDAPGGEFGIENCQAGVTGCAGSGECYSC